VVLSVAANTDPRRATTETARVFPVIMPNTQNLDLDWRIYAVSVKDVEDLAGFRYFGNLVADVAEQIKARKPETRDKALAKGTGKGSAKKGRKGSELELSPNLRDEPAAIP
jgi:DNA/RNA endonuclease G (NUC1)